MSQQRFSIFIVEDEFLIAEELVSCIRRLGDDCVGRVGNPRTAVLLARGEIFDVAVLDTRLGSERFDQVADILVQRRIPFAFSVARFPHVDHARWPYALILPKPYELGQLEEMLGRLLGRL